MRRMSRKVRRVGPSSSSSRVVDFGFAEGGDFAVDGCEGPLLLLVVGMLVLERRLEEAMVVEGGKVINF